MTEAPRVIMGEASDETRGWACQIDTGLSARCVSLDPYSPAPTELAVGVLVTYQPAHPLDRDENYGRRCTVTEEIPTDRWPIWVVTFLSGETTSTDNPEDLQIEDRWVVAGEEPEHIHLLSYYQWIHCDWPRRFPGDTHGNH